MTIKFADQKIKEARQRVAALDRELADLRRQSHSARLSRLLKQEMREHSTRLEEERCRAYWELAELIELSEMPPECMAWA